MLRLVLLASLLIACTPRPQDMVIERSGRVGIQTGLRLGWAIKRVLTKQPPETIVAEDGTVCRLAPDRYAKTEVGSRLECDWQLGEPPTDTADHGDGEQGA